MTRLELFRPAVCATNKKVQMRVGTAILSIALTISGLTSAETINSSPWTGTFMGYGSLVNVQVVADSLILSWYEVLNGGTIHTVFALSDSPIAARVSEPETHAMLLAGLGLLGLAADPKTMIRLPSAFLQRSHRLRPGCRPNGMLKPGARGESWLPEWMCAH